MRAVITLVVALLLTGCPSHGTGATSDAGATPDAGTMSARDAGSLSVDGGHVCQNACPSLSALRCVGESRESCFEGPDGCLEWTPPLSCPTGQICEAEAGACKPVFASLALVAGQLGGPGYADQTADSARFEGRPAGLVYDGAGNLYVADDHTVRRVAVATGEVTTLAGLAFQGGSSDGTGVSANFSSLAALAYDEKAGYLYAADSGNHAIRKIVIATGEVTTLAGTARTQGNTDGIGVDARFDTPVALAYDGQGQLYVADINNTIRQVDVVTGKVTTLAGTAYRNGSVDGVGADARFNSPGGLAYDGRGSLYVADTNNQAIRQVVVATGAVTTIAAMVDTQGPADGGTIASSFNSPSTLALDGAGNLYVADSGAIRQLVIATGAVTTLPNSGAPSYDFIGGLTSDHAGRLFVGQAGKISELELATGEVTALAGKAPGNGNADGTGSAASFNYPWGLAYDGAGSVYVADSENSTIRKIEVESGLVTTLAGTPGHTGNADGVGPAASFSGPYGLAYDATGRLFVADAGNSTIREVDVATGTVTTIAGSGRWGSKDGVGTAASFGEPRGLALDGAGHLFVSDFIENTIREIDLATGAVTTLAGTANSRGNADGMGANASFDAPSGLACDNMGHLFVADPGNVAIREIDVATGTVTTLAGMAGPDATGADVWLFSPQGLAYDGTGHLYVAEAGTSMIRRIEISTRTVSTMIGAYDQTGVLLGPLPAGLNNPQGLATGPAGSELFIADVTENAVLVAR